MRIDELKKAISKSDILDRKEEFTKGTLTKVIYQLKKGPVELVKKYEEIETAISQLTEQRQAINVQMKEKMEDIFSAEEKTLTRVLELADFNVSLSKEYMSGETTVVDYEAIVAELIERMTPAALALVNEVKDKYTKINEAQHVVARLTIKKNKEKKDIKISKKGVKEAREPITHNDLKKQSLLSKVLDWVAKFSNQVLHDMIPKLNAYDLKLERLKIKANLKK